MGRGAGKRLFDFSSQPGTRLAASNGETHDSFDVNCVSPSSFNLRGAAPAPANAPVGHAPAPSTVRQAHLFDEHGLKLVLGSTANRVLSDDEAADLRSFLERVK